jgi:flagellar biogenesis protein FliO
MTFFGDRLQSAIQDPRAESFMILIALVLALVLVMAWLRRRFGKADSVATRSSTPDEEDRAQLPDDKSDAPTRYVRSGFL